MISSKKKKKTTNDLNNLNYESKIQNEIPFPENMLLATLAKEKKNRLDTTRAGSAYLVNNCLMEESLIIF